ESARLRQLIIEEVKRQPRVALPIVRRLSSWKRVAGIAAMVALATTIVLALVIFGGRVPKVYADAVSDHVDHCTLEALVEDVKDPLILKPAAKDYCGLAFLPDISQFGFSNPYGRECKLDEEVFLHLIYFNSDKMSVSVFLSTHSSKDIASSLKLRELAGYTIASINSSGVDLMVLTTLDRGQTRQISESIASQIRQATQSSQNRGRRDARSSLQFQARTGTAGNRRVLLPAFASRPL